MRQDTINFVKERQLFPYMSTTCCTANYENLKRETLYNSKLRNYKRKSTKWEYYFVTYLMEKKKGCSVVSITDNLVAVYNQRY